MKNKFYKTKNWIILIVLFTITLSINSTTVLAQGAGVPIGTGFDFQSIMNYTKSFTLDKLATMAAKQVLHQITGSVIEWINSGFKGSPAFLNNPGAFFLDAADQVTGAFLAGNGPLSSLCSPFAIDIRLSLALSQTSFASQRYTCTLGKIIEAQKNGPEIIVNGQVVKSSQNSMDGFLRGDFNQGGWPAFIALTTETQNNPYGAFFSAHGDLSARINARQNVIRADLQLGQGFMSWEDCKDIPGGTIDPNDEYQVTEAESIVGSDPSVRAKPNKDGTVSYQTCETKTPGSVISGTLQKNLNVPVTELELADDINAIMNALMNKLTMTVLEKGLGAISGGGSGGGVSYTQQIINDTRNSRDIEQMLEKLRSDIISAQAKIDYYSPIYVKAVSILTETENRLLSAKACFANKGSSEYAGNYMSEIELILETDIKPNLDQMKAEVELGRTNKQELTALSVELAGANYKNLEETSRKFNELAQSGGLYFQHKESEAKQKLSDIEDLAKEIDEKTVRFVRACNAIF